jgi:hypothetical protein
VLGLRCLVGCPGTDIASAPALKYAYGAGPRSRPLPKPPSPKGSGPFLLPSSAARYVVPHPTRPLRLGSLLKLAAYVGGHLFCTELRQLEIVDGESAVPVEELSSFPGIARGRGTRGTTPLPDPSADFLGSDAQQGDHEPFQQGYVAGWRSVRGADDYPPLTPPSPVFVGPMMYMIGFSRGARDARSMTPDDPMRSE